MTEIVVFGTSATSVAIAKTLFDLGNTTEIRNPIVNIVCPSCDVSQISSALLSHNIAVNFVTDEDVFSKHKTAESELNRLARRGWYRQQFLKLIYYFEKDSDLLILDGDTYFSRAFFRDFGFIKNAPAVKENITPYQSCMSNVLRYLDRPFDLSVSTIANFGYWKHTQLRDMSREQFELFLLHIIKCINGPDRALFSEYLLMSSLDEERRDSKAFRIFRRMDLLSNTFISLIGYRGYHAYCFEYEHDNYISKRILAHIAYLLGLRLW